MWWRVEPGHVGFGMTVVDRQIFVVRAARAAKLEVIALIPTATGHRREDLGEQCGS